MMFYLAAARLRHAGPAAAPAAAPMGAPGGGPAAPVPTVACEFTIENLEYEDVAEHEEARDGIREAVKAHIDGAIEAAVGAPASAPAAGAESSGAPAPGGPAPAFVQLHAKPKIFAKATASSAISHSTSHSVAAPGAAPSAASPAAAPAPDNVDTYVALGEGPEDAVQTEATCVAAPDKQDAVVDAMKDCCKPNLLANALLGAEGIKWKHAPIVTGCRVVTKEIERWGMDCGPHVKTMIDRFAVAYTRAQVPHAIEQACHLFESKISFSGNHRITKWDKRACKTATEKLMNKWKGKPSHNATDYDDWCHDICELKLGHGAPQCHL